jgi:hypothetical protein
MQPRAARTGIGAIMIIVIVAVGAYFLLPGLTPRTHSGSITARTPSRRRGSSSSRRRLSDGELAEAVRQASVEASI